MVRSRLGAANRGGNRLDLAALAARSSTLYALGVAYLAHLLSDALRHWVIALVAFVILVLIAWSGIALLRSRAGRRRALRIAVAENLRGPTAYRQARQRVGFHKAGRGATIILAAFIGFILFVFFGSWLTVPLIYRHGETGEGVVTGQYRTADFYNDEPVIGFNVIIRKADGGIVRTGFRSDSFNVYPPANRVRYPPAGARFNVRYLPDHPEDFVIVANDASAWARSLRCDDLRLAAAAAQRERDFSPADAAAAERHGQALDQARNAGCG